MTGKGADNCGLWMLVLTDNSRLSAVEADEDTKKPAVQHRGCLGWSNGQMEQITRQGPALLSV